MDVCLRLRRWDGVGLSYATGRGGGETATRAPLAEVALENARALTTALRDSPAVRDDVLHRATRLLGNADYPSAETIWKISRLLAVQIEGESESGRMRAT